MLPTPGRALVVAVFVIAVLFPIVPSAVAQSDTPEKFKPLLGTWEGAWSHHAYGKGKIVLVAQKIEGNSLIGVVNVGAGSGSTAYSGRDNPLNAVINTSENGTIWIQFYNGPISYTLTLKDERNLAGRNSLASEVILTKQD